MHIKITLGLVIAVLLIFFWYRQDHPSAVVAVPAKAVQSPVTLQPAA